MFRRLFQVALAADAIGFTEECRGHSLRGGESGGVVAGTNGLGFSRNAHFRCGQRGRCGR